MITFFNATNLYEWDADTVLAHTSSEKEWKPHGTMRLIFDEMKSQPLIMASIRANTKETCALDAYLFTSTNDYFAKNEEAVSNRFAKTVNLPPLRDSLLTTFNRSKLAKRQGFSLPDSAANTLAPPHKKRKISSK